MSRTNHSDDLLDCIPNLRRYAFCLVGRIDEGDALVEQVLRKLPAVGAVPSGSSCSVGLFKAFNADRDVDAACRDAAARNCWVITDALHGEILALPIRLRKIFILVRTIGFSREETAEIVPCPVTDVVHCLTEAADRILRNTRPRQGGFAQYVEAATQTRAEMRSGETVPGWRS